MGVKSTVTAAAALVAVKTDNLKEEFKLAKSMAQSDEVVSQIQRNVTKAEAKVLRAAEVCEQRAEQLAEAETALEVAKAELEQARADALASQLNQDQVDA